ncbi:MAG TPA: multicopper oxidase [Micromonosporaceae bacterium]
MAAIDQTGPRFTRRQVLRLAGAAGAGALFGGASLIRASGSGYALPLPGGTLAPSAIAKYVTPLVIPPVMPRTGRIARHGERGLPYYEIAVRQFRQQLLPAPLPATTVWSYGSATSAGTFHYPAFTIEAHVDVPVRVKWINGLKDVHGRFLPHLLPVDPTLHWANPPGGADGRDRQPTFTRTPGPYRGPVPIVTHLHGGHNRQESDGYPEAWYLPAARDIPAGYAAVGSYYEEFRREFEWRFGQPWQPGAAIFQYDNDQPAATMWYHDHTLGLTRTNVYAGPAGFYLLRGGPYDLPHGVLPGPAPDRPTQPQTSRHRARTYEIPLVIQDRSFNRDGALFYPASRQFFDQFAGPFIPDSDIAPIWNPEVFGNTMVVNGRTWPQLEVEPRRYRFRLLNGCNTRFLLLKLTTGRPTIRPAVAALPFWQVGAEGGFLPHPVELAQLLVAPAERADVIVDFAGLPAGTHVHLVNEGPDEPFGGGVPGVDFAFADPATTGQVMRFVVTGRKGADRSVPPAQLTLPTPPPVPATRKIRRVSLNEVDSAVLPGVGPQSALLGVVAADGTGRPLRWSDPVSEHPALDATEVWELHNFTQDAHPIHIHEVQFSVVNREPIAGGPVRMPEPWETGRKDTVIAYPGEITRVRSTFDLPGRYVWHCHILEHEDNEMMRPYLVGGS